jgi:octaprenyl-diphosphate synthase
MKNKQDLATDIQNIKNYLKDDLEIVDNILSSISKDDNQLISGISNDLISNKGKRIRPSLNILAAGLFNYKKENLYFLSAAIEAIHAATLLHDDVIDNSDLRRGVETANNKYGNKAAILVGDFIFAKSFSYMVGTRSFEALDVLASTSAIIAKGEVMQLQAQKNPGFSMEDYIEIITAKTAELFAASTETAAIIAGRSSSEARMLREFGLNLGIAFQIIDDLLDYKSSTKIMGKKLGDDFFEQKVTCPIILLIEKSDEYTRNEIKSYFKLSNPSNKELNYIISLLESKNIFSYCQDYAGFYVGNALKILDNFPDSDARDVLRLICQNVVSRNL